MVGKTRREPLQHGGELFFQGEIHVEDEIGPGKTRHVGGGGNVVVRIDARPEQRFDLGAAAGDVLRATSAIISTVAKDADRGLLRIGAFRRGERGDEAESGDRGQDARRGPIWGCAGRIGELSDHEASSPCCRGAS